jgi:hypothetical protein
MPLMGDLYGFDPFYLMGQPEPLGFDIQRTDQGYRLEIPVRVFGRKTSTSRSRIAS